MVNRIRIETRGKGETMASEERPNYDVPATKVTGELSTDSGDLNELSVIKYKMNKYKVAIMLANRLTKNYTEGYLNAQREVMLTGLSLYGRLYDIGYVDRERYARDVLELVSTYEKHVKEAPIISSVRGIRSSTQNPDGNLPVSSVSRATLDLAKEAPKTVDERRQAVAAFSASQSYSAPPVTSPTTVIEPLSEQDLQTKPAYVVEDEEDEFEDIFAPVPRKAPRPGRRRRTFLSKFSDLFRQ